MEEDAREKWVEAEAVLNAVNALVSTWLNVRSATRQGQEATVDTDLSK
jgi:hypothetical protein